MHARAPRARVKISTRIFGLPMVKQQNTSFQNENKLLRQSLYSRMRITSTTIYIHIPGYN